ncbi:T4SS effector SidA family protein [Legionella shakespearei]|uniref:SidA protein, subsrate of the Dot/Icm transport system n=1 Tax=Legionella shakespearei DSM 23087 TaxID=1122169 RepID=A0A0W0YHK0_9GAMM|nr:T4SS effector SidA family protein [Legionella shakespearei]KTD56429.1 SidA protein, subsrate of the Dot/Icm transport system [Legionella shakespearei DSM 23087]
MANYSHTPQKLSPKMGLLKKELENRALHHQSFIEEVHKGSNLLSNVTGFIHHTFNIISSAMSAAKAIPLLGAFIQLASVVPKAIAILTDPEKSKSEKAISALLILVLVALSIVALTVGSSAALIVGIVMASIVTAVDGLGFIGSIFEKYKISQAYNLKKELDGLLEQRIMPENDKYNDELELRALELEHKISTNKLADEEKKRFVEELEFINSILKQKNIVAGNKPNSSALKLKQHYATRQEQMSALTDKLVEAESSKDDNLKAKILDEILEMEKELILTERAIEDLTKSTEELNAESFMASSTIALSGSTAALSAAGLVISVLALVLVVGGVAAPQFVIPAVIGIGIGLAVLGFMKFVAEKLVEMETNRRKENKAIVRKEGLRNEMLYDYGHQNQNSNAHMHELLEISSLDKELEKNSNPATVKEQEQSFPALFSSTPEPTQTEEAHDATPVASIREA